MIVYCLLFIIASFFGLFVKKEKVFQLSTCGNRFSKIVTNNKKSIPYVVFILILATLVAGLRNISVGADTSSYVDSYFKPIFSYAFLHDKSTEFILDVIAWFASLFSHKYTMFLFLVSLITISLFLKFIFDNSNNVFLSVVIFLGMFYVQSLNLMREWLAIGFGLNAYTMFARKKYIPSLLFLLLAFFTHSSSLCLVVIPFLRIFKNKNRVFVISTIVCLLLIIFKGLFFNVIVSFFPQYISYVSSGFFMNEGEFNPKDFIFVIILLIYLFYVFFKKSLFSEKELRDFYDYSIFLLFSITFSFMGQQFFMFHRIVFYFSVFLIISLPNFFARFKSQSLLYGLVIVAMVIMLLRNIVNDNNGISNFSWFWD